LAERVLEPADSLDTFSERGRIVPEVGDATLRELLIDPFRLMYEVDERQVRIVGVHSPATTLLGPRMICARGLTRALKLAAPFCCRSLLFVKPSRSRRSLRAFR
jgi:hypothetical protein